MQTTKCFSSWRGSLRVGRDVSHYLHRFSFPTDRFLASVSLRVLLVKKLNVNRGLLSRDRILRTFDQMLEEYNEEVVSGRGSR